MPTTDFEWMYGFIKLIFWGAVAYFILGPLLGRVICTLGKKKES